MLWELLILGTALGVKAAPAFENEFELEKRGGVTPKFCTAIRSDLMSGIYESAATPYCSSVLSIPPVVTVTNTAYKTMSTTINTVSRSTLFKTFTRYTTLSDYKTLRATKSQVGVEALSTYTTTVVETDVESIYTTETATETTSLTTTIQPISQATETAYAPCGVPVDSSVTNFRGVDDTLNDAYFHTCQTLCDNTAGCLFFAFTADGTNCFTVSQPMSDITQPGDGMYIAFAKNCPPQSNTYDNVILPRDVVAIEEALVKKDVPVPVPTDLQTYNPGLVSLACSCLNLTAHTVTKSTTTTIGLKMHVQTVVVRATTTLTKSVSRYLGRATVLTVTVTIPSTSTLVISTSTSMQTTITESDSITVSDISTLYDGETTTLPTTTQTISV